MSTRRFDLPPKDSDSTLFARAKDGDYLAWNELFNKCYPMVIRVVRRKLNPPMRSLYDSMDFASDVMKSLAARAESLEFQSLESLVAYLAEVAEKKVIDEYRKVHCQKRDITREQPLIIDDGDGSRPRMIASSDPTASQMMLATEAHERLLAGKTGTERDVIEMKHQGYSPTEIAAQTGWHLRRVQRFIKDLRESVGWF